MLCNLLLQDCSVLTPEMTVKEHQSIAINDGKIIEIGPAEELNNKYTAEKTLNGRGKLAMPGLVETSTNLASVKFVDDKTIVVTSSQRSSVESAKTYVAQMVESVFSLAGADVAHTDGYPGWNPNPESRLLEITVNAYKDLFATEPKVRAIHAGLECGLFLEKYPELEMVSFGPTLRGVHSPDERLEIATVPKFWDLLCEVLRRI
jgi:dipeptidase D